MKGRTISMKFYVTDSSCLYIPVFFVYLQYTSECYGHFPHNKIWSFRMLKNAKARLSCSRAIPFCGSSSYYAFFNLKCQQQIYVLLLINTPKIDSNNVISFLIPFIFFFPCTFAVCLLVVFFFFFYNSSFTRGSG